MAEGESESDVQERALMNLVAGLPEDERERTLARLLNELERLHREHGAPVPPWVDRIRKRHGL